MPAFTAQVLPPFRCGSTFSLGVEEELHVVAPDTLAPLYATDALLQAGEWTRGRATGEISDAIIEFVTPICARAGEAVEILGGMRADTARRDVALIGAGLHPDARFGEVRHRAGARYEQIARLCAA